jgi:hypothetical protein
MRGVALFFWDDLVPCKSAEVAVVVDGQAGQLPVWTPLRTWRHFGEGEACQETDDYSADVGNDSSSKGDASAEFFKFMNSYELVVEA